MTWVEEPKEAVEEESDSACGLIHADTEAQLFGVFGQTIASINKANEAIGVIGSAAASECADECALVRSGTEDALFDVFGDNSAEETNVDGELLEMFENVAKAVMMIGIMEPSDLAETFNVSESKAMEIEKFLGTKVSSDLEEMIASKTVKIVIEAFTSTTIQTAEQLDSELFSN